MGEPMQNRNKPPCKGCEKRYYGCQDHCKEPALIAWKAENEKIRKARQAYRQGAWLRDEAYQPRNPIKRSKRK